MNLLGTLAFALVGLSAAIQAVRAVSRREAPDHLSHWLLLGAALLLAALEAWRSIAIGFPALTGVFESLVFLSAMTCVVCFVYRVQNRLPWRPLVQFGATVGALVLLAVASSPIAPREVLAPVPALRSYWLVAHVALAFVGESLYLVSFVASIAWLAGRDEGRRRDYDRLAYTAVALGYPVFTAGALVFGMIWAEQAWGTWWSWDPKETWALVTWLVYTLYLHVRLGRRREGALPAWICVLGFLCAAFTFFGVNYLLPGLHSYR